MSFSALMQAAEYLDLLRDGTEQVEVPEAVASLADAAARLLWPAAQLDGSAPDVRSIVFVKVNHGADLLAHVPTGDPDCFLILVLPSQEAPPARYILFDIGAEYLEARFICPAFDVDEAAEADTIKQCLPQLSGQRDPYAILELTGGTYMQVLARDGGFHLEHQLVNTFCHYELDSLVAAEVAVEAFLSYAFGCNEWAYKHQWRRMVL